MTANGFLPRLAPPRELPRRTHARGELAIGDRATRGDFTGAVVNAQVETRDAAHIERNVAEILLVALEVPPQLIDRFGHSGRRRPKWIVVHR